MASYFVQADDNLYQVDPDGTFTLLTIPASLTLYGATQPVRSTLFQVGETALIIGVNGATHDFYIDTYGVIRKLQIASPTSYPVPSAGAGTDLTGVYKVACTFKVKDANGQTLLESGMGPISTSTSLTSKTIALASIPVSGDPDVNARGLYRTLSGGNVLYPWFDIDDNTTLSEDRGVADSLLSLLPTVAIRYGTPPELKLIASWRDRLWGAPRSPIDHVRWTDEHLFYGWSQDNEIIIPPQNTDAFGVTAFIPRRDNIGIARRRSLYMISGTSNDSFQRIGVSESLGCVSQESVVVIENVAYMLGDMGVNEWSDSGMRCVSDVQVATWFITDRFFNRAQFHQAQGRYNPDTNCYELLLCGVGSTSLDRWIAYDLASRTWLGPHLTDAFTPTCTASGIGRRGTLTDADDLPITAFGGDDGIIYKRDQDAILDNTTGVSFSLELPPLSANEPDLFKFFDRPTIHTRMEDQGSLVIMPIVGNLADIQGDTAYAQVILEDTPKAYYRFEEADSLTFFDASGNGFDGTASAPTGFTYGVTGAVSDGTQGISTDGLQSTIIIDDLVLGTTCSFEVWLKASASGSAFGGIVGNASVGTGFYYIPATGLLDIDINGVTDNYNHTPLTYGVLHHIVVSISAGSGIFYVNGAVDGTFTGWPGFTANRLLNISGSALFASLVDELAIYKHALTATQVQTHYLRGITDPRINHDLTLDRETLPRLGAGRYCRLNLSHSSTEERLRIYGLELPYSILSRR